MVKDLLGGTGYLASFKLSHEQFNQACIFLNEDDLSDYSGTTGKYLSMVTDLYQSNLLSFYNLCLFHMRNKTRFVQPGANVLQPGTA